MHKQGSLLKNILATTAITYTTLVTGCEPQQQNKPQVETHKPPMYNTECVEDGYFHTTCPDTTDIIYRPTTKERE